MEWYAVQMFSSTVQTASFLGAIQLIAIAAILIFDFSLPKPTRDED